MKSLLKNMASLLAVPFCILALTRAPLAEAAPGDLLVVRYTLQVTLLGIADEHAQTILRPEIEVRGLPAGAWSGARKFRPSMEEFE